MGNHLRYLTFYWVNKNMCLAPIEIKYTTITKYEAGRDMHFNSGYWWLTNTVEVTAIFTHISVNSFLHHNVNR